MGKTELAATAWLRAIFAPRWRFPVIAVLFLAPTLVGILTRLIKHKSYFADFRQLVCAGQHVAQGLPLYGPGSACPAMDAMPFVYIPGVAHVSSGFMGVLGSGGFTLLYAALFVLAAVSMVFTLVFDRRVPGTPQERVPTLALITGSAVSWGNIALPLSALIGAAAVVLESWPILFVLAVALATVVKPLYAACLLPLIYLPRSRVQRAGLIALGLILGLTPVALFLFTGGEAAKAWSFQTEHYVATQASGFGFLGWQTLLFRYSGLGPLTLIAYAVFTGSSLLALLVIAARGGLDVRSKVWLSLAVACLIVPRVMRYDVFLLGLGLIVTVYAAEALSVRAGRIVAGLVYAGLGIALLMNFAVGGNQLFLITLLFWGVLVGLAIAMVRRPGEADAVETPALDIGPAAP